MQVQAAEVIKTDLYLIVLPNVQKKFETMVVIFTVSLADGHMSNTGFVVMDRTRLPLVQNILSSDPEAPRDINYAKV